MDRKALFILLALFLIAGCTVGTTHNMRLRGNVNPGQISLDKRMPVSIEASVENIGNSTETITIDAADDTQGISIEKPERTSFTLKPGESRIVVFIGTLEETAPPGKYRIDITATTKGDDVISETAFLTVIAERGFI